MSTKQKHGRSADGDKSYKPTVAAYLHTIPRRSDLAAENEIYAVISMCVMRCDEGICEGRKAG